MKLKSVLTQASKTPARQMSLFAWLNLGIIESLANGVISTANAIEILYNAENCVYVRKHLRDKTADEIMSRGVQLSDLFSVLSREEANREFQRELAAMRSLCLKVLEKRPLVA